MRETVNRAHFCAFSVFQTHLSILQLKITKTNKNKHEISRKKRILSESASRNSQDSTHQDQILFKKMLDDTPGGLHESDLDFPSISQIAESDKQAFITLPKDSEGQTQRCSSLGEDNALIQELLLEVIWKHERETELRMLRQQNRAMQELLKSVVCECGDSTVETEPPKSMQKLLEFGKLVTQLRSALNIKLDKLEEEAEWAENSAQFCQQAVQRVLKETSDRKEQLTRPDPVNLCQEAIIELVDMIGGSSCPDRSLYEQSIKAIKQLDEKYKVYNNLIVMNVYYAL